MPSVAELRDKSPAELQAELRTVQRALVGLRAEISNQASENTAGLGKLRREIAQIKTVLRAKLAADATPAAAASAPPPAAADATATEAASS